MLFEFEGDEPDEVEVQDEGEGIKVEVQSGKSDNTFTIQLPREEGQEYTFLSKTEGATLEVDGQAETGTITFTKSFEDFDEGLNYFNYNITLERTQTGRRNLAIGDITEFIVELTIF